MLLPVTLPQSLTGTFLPSHEIPAGSSGLGRNSLPFGRSGDAIRCDLGIVISLGLSGALWRLFLHTSPSLGALQVTVTRTPEEKAESQASDEPRSGEEPRDKASEASASP